MEFHALRVFSLISSTSSVPDFNPAGVSQMGREIKKKIKNDNKTSLFRNVSVPVWWQGRFVYTWIKSRPLNEVLVRLLKLNVHK